MRWPMWRREHHTCSIRACFCFPIVCLHKCMILCNRIITHPFHHQALTCHSLVLYWARAGVMLVYEILVVCLSIVIHIFIDTRCACNWCKVWCYSICMRPKYLFRHKVNPRCFLSIWSFCILFVLNSTVTFRYVTWLAFVCIREQSRCRLVCFGFYMPLIQSSISLFI